MTHTEVVIVRRAVEEGRGLVVIVNKMDLLRGKKNSTFYKEVMEAVPKEIETVIPQVCLCTILYGVSPYCSVPIAVLTNYYNFYIYMTWIPSLICKQIFI